MSATVKQIHLTSQVPRDQWPSLLGKKLGPDDYDHIIDYDADVYTPEGEILVRFRKNCLPIGESTAAYRELRRLNQRAKNRGMASGKGLASRHRLKDGTMPKTRYVDHDSAPITNIVGFFDRQERQPFLRFPYCRQTAFNAKQPEAWGRCLPFIKSVARIYAREAPEEYARHMETVARCSQDFVIPGTPYTTITVNKNWQTAVHTDKGDLKSALSCITAFHAGEYTGGYTVFPHYRVGVDLRTCDLMMFNPHHMHGNTPLRGRVNSYERVSLVLYFREKMLECGTADEELERAKKNPRASQYFGDSEKVGNDT